MPRIYSFAGCVMEGATFLQLFKPGNATSIRGISTEGVLRLLSGEEISLDEHQLQQVQKHANLFVRYGTYDGLSDVDGILWTPVNDAIFLTPMARCPDKTSYPIYDGGIDVVLGTTGASLSQIVINALWAQLQRNTQHIKNRVVIHYPTDHLGSGVWKQRIDTIQQSAKEQFGDWKHYIIDAEPEAPNGYWAHYSKAAKEQLWATVEKGLI